ncbi:MAG: hypothetical protein AAB655_01595 [Patescibacteria group bacterium]
MINPGEQLEGGQSAPLRERYLDRADEEGYVYIREFAGPELNAQTKTLAGLADGEEGTNEDLNLGEGLRFLGSSGNYPDMKIHIDDLENFVERVRNHLKEAEE